MDLKKNFGTDAKLELEGVWQDIGDGARVLIARIGNKNHTARINELRAPYKVQIRAGRLGDDVWQKIATKAMPGCILLDWEGLKDDGKPVVYSEEKALELLTKYPDFRDLVSGLANEIDSFQKAEEEKVLKN